MKQEDLFGTPDEPSNPIEARFWMFHAENPHVYRLFCRFAQQALNHGYEHFSSDMIMHRIRWETAIETTETYAPPGEGVLKLNDHYSAYYSRLWMRDHPGMCDFFRTRVLKNGDVSEQLRAAA